MCQWLLVLLCFGCSGYDEDRGVLVLSSNAVDRSLGLRTSVGRYGPKTEESLQAPPVIESAPKRWRKLASVKLGVKVPEVNKTREIIKKSGRADRGKMERRIDV